jgi:chitinase
VIGGGLLAALTAALVTFVFAGTAFADTIQFTGQGTNNDGTCETFQQDSGVPAGKQVWQFNLTSTNSGATMSATFSDGTTVTNKAEDDHNGNTSMWFITTDLGAMVTSASATFTPTQGNPQFVVSHCSTNGPPPTTAPPTTTTPTTEPSTTTPSTTAPGGPEVGGITAERPQAAVAVVAQPGFTG